MLALRIVAAHLALVAAWTGALALLGFRAVPMELALLALGLVTSSVLVTRALLARDRESRVDAGSGAVGDATPATVEP